MKRGKDYAFNNILIIMAADGEFAKEEMMMAVRLAKKWGYNTDKINYIFHLASSRQLVIRMPEDQGKREKIFKMMEKAAAIDGVVSPEEKLLLDNVKKQYIRQA